VVLFDDERIAAMLAEAKEPCSVLRLRSAGNKLVCNCNARGAAGRTYRIMARASIHDAAAFSVIVALVRSETSSLYNLRRYNGNDHAHLNPIEGTRCDFQCHIHTATERYQAAGRSAEQYAEATLIYCTVEGAWRLMLQDCGFEPPGTAGEQLSLSWDE
jgi:hypothetical protein